ncbi:hypothetical protein HWI79_3034 [Cryptosporidium felis]|nr:hypothetical protein HWI79_3034 [Cryptosporidium felis]
MENKDRINLLSADFDALLAINNLDHVFFPKNTHSLDNIGKAALLLPFGIQKKLMIFRKDQMLSEDEKVSIPGDLRYVESELNSLKNNEYKIIMKNKYSLKRDKFYSISNYINNKFMDSKKCINSVESKRISTFNNRKSRNEVGFS